MIAGAGFARAQDTDTTPGTPDTTAGTSETTTGGRPAGRMITLSDFGAEDLGYLAIPSTPPQMGLVLVPDAYGLDGFTKGEADRLAGLGYLVVAIDIYNGHRSTDPGEMANEIANQNLPIVMKTVDAGIRVFHESPKFRTGHVVAIGWGNGARYVFQAARENQDLDGGVMFYGPVETNVEKIGKFAAPLCAIYPDNDPVTTHENVQVFEQMMKDVGNDFSAWFIAAGSGWSNPASKTYNPVEDKEAWKVALPFLVRIGAEPVKIHKESIMDKAKDGVKSGVEKIENIFK
jgi:carboxymethylenebutenolidase